MADRGIAGRLWRVPAYLPYLQPNLTTAAVEHAERHIHAKLPAEYITALHEQNGGYVRLMLSDSVHSMIWGIGPHFPNILEDHDGLDPSSAEFDQWVPERSDRLVPFDGDGHWYLCFDYRKGDTAAVTYIDLGNEVDSAVAPTFSAFLKTLRLDLSPGDFAVVGDCSLDGVADALERQLKSKFEPPDDNAHGYPVRRCRVGGPKNLEWVWLSPNLVNKGFVRASYKRYEELRDCLPGTALRLPEYPEATVLVGCTEGVSALVRESCERAGLLVCDLAG